MEQITRDEKEIRMALPGLFDDRLKGKPYGLFPFFAPGAVAVRDHSPMDIGGMDKFHG